MENKYCGIVSALTMMDELKRLLSENKEYEIKCVKLYISWLYNVIPRIPAIEQTMLVELIDRLEAFSKVIEDDKRITTSILEVIENALTGGETE